MKLSEFIDFNCNDSIWYKVKRPNNGDLDIGVLYKYVDSIPTHILNLEVQSFKIVPHNEFTSIVVCYCK